MFWDVPAARLSAYRRESGDRSRSKGLKVGPAGDESQAALGSEARIPKICKTVTLRPEVSLEAMAGGVAARG